MLENARKKSTGYNLFHNSLNKWILIKGYGQIVVITQDKVK